jgi:hypothetical protein
MLQFFSSGVYNFAFVEKSFMEMSFIGISKNIIEIEMLLEAFLFIEI